MLYLLQQYAITFGWALTGAVSMAISLGIMLKIFDWLTPVNEWEELKKGNKPVAIYLAAVVIGTAFVIGIAIMP